MATITVAQLTQPGDVYTGLEDIDDADFDARIHLLADDFGGECDLPPNKYYWDRAEHMFRPIATVVERPTRPEAPSALAALAVSLIVDIYARMREKTPNAITDWLDFYVMSVDFPAALRRSRPVAKYIIDRGLAPRGAIR